MTCTHAASGCNYPEGECAGFCLNKGLEVIYKSGTKLVDRESGEVFVVYNSNESITHYQGASGSGDVRTSEVPTIFEVDANGVPDMLAPSVLYIQEGGDHYKKLGAYQPWEVLRRWLTPEEFRGYMKGTAIAYLAREQDKGGMLDIRKAGHTLQGLIELLGAE
jgi:hypothetical protein